MSFKFKKQDSKNLYLNEYLEEVKKSDLVKNFYHKIDKYRLSVDKETYKKKFKEFLEKEKELL